MKTIYLLRHAKSSWKDSSLDDIQRPLNKRGRLTAAAMGRFLADEGIMPAMILCSSSVRTRETLDGIAEFFAEPVPTRFEPSIYEADVATLLNRVCRLNNQLASVMVIGHNPGMEELTRLLAPGGGKAGALEATATMAGKFATGSLAVIEAKVADWADVKAGCGDLMRFVPGRSLIDHAEE